MEKTGTCQFCGYEGDTEIYTYNKLDLKSDQRPPPTFKYSQELCDPCAYTLGGNMNEWPNHYGMETRDLAKIILHCTNMIIDAIKQKDGGK